MASRHARGASVLAITALFVVILTAVYPYTIQGDSNSVVGDSRGAETLGSAAGSVDQAIALRLGEAARLSRDLAFVEAGESCFEILKDHPDGRADLLSSALGRARYSYEQLDARERFVAQVDECLSIGNHVIEERLLLAKWDVSRELSWHFASIDALNHMAATHPGSEGLARMYFDAARELLSQPESVNRGRAVLEKIVAEFPETLHTHQHARDWLDAQAN